MRGGLRAISTSAALLAVACLFLSPAARAQSSSASPGLPCAESPQACSGGRIDFGVTPDDFGGSLGPFGYPGTPLSTQFVYTQSIVFGSAVYGFPPKPPTVLVSDDADECAPADRSSGSPAFKTDWWCQFNEGLLAGVPMPRVLGVTWFSAQVCYIDGPPGAVLMQGFSINGGLLVEKKSTTTGSELMKIKAPPDEYIYQVRIVSSVDPAGLSIDCLDYPDPVNPSKSCGDILINKDFVNKGPEANDLHVVVKGNPLIVDFYKSPFTKFSYTYDKPLPGQTTIEWSGATVPTNDAGHVGWVQYETDAEVLDFYWTKDGQRIGGNKAFQVSCHVYLWGIELENGFTPLGIPEPVMTVRDLKIAVPGSFVPLDSLNRRNLQLAAALQPLRDSVVLPFGRLVPIRFRTPIQGGDWVVLRMTIDDPASSASIVDYVEAEPGTEIPTLSEWGAIIFGTLLLAGVLFFIWRRRRALTA